MDNMKIGKLLNKAYKNGGYIRMIDGRKKELLDIQEHVELLLRQIIKRVHLFIMKIKNISLFI